MRAITITLLFNLVFLFQSSEPIYKDTNQPVDTRVEDILKRLSLKEKIDLLHANGKFSSAGIERLGIPDLKYTDGPFGIREELEKDTWKPLKLTTDSATFFPTGSALAATWSTDLAYRYGEAIGEEARARGKDILLAPAVNINRTPLCGRNFEYMSEDPYLNARLAVEYIDGVQKNDVAACVKHFAANNQETERGSINVLMNERTLREIYLPAFKAAVTEANSYTVMAAYNKLRGDYCSENDYLLNHILKTEWNFKGAVMSDWGGTHSTVKAALNGLDIEMGSRGSYDKFYFADALLDSVKAGKVDEKTIDDKVRRILRVMLWCKTTDPDREKGKFTTPGHFKTAYDIASQSIVLLKNSGNLLPLSLENVKSIAVIGENATHTHAHGGFGAGVKTKYEITPLEGLQQKIGKTATINFALGYKSKFNGKYPDNKPNISLVEEAVGAAKKSDVAIIFAGTNHNVETEGTDRENIKLPFGQDELIKAVTKANPKTIVVIVAGAQLDLSQINEASSCIVWSWFNGSEGGNALADVLFGKINPSGKLPFTIPVKLEDSPAHALHSFPGENSSTEYTEGILVGYRWFDTKKINPLFCFGYGLSYTTFKYTGLSLSKNSIKASDSINIHFTLKNTGNKPGWETVQVYVTKDNSVVERPSKELKRFSKIYLQPAESKEIDISLTAKDLAYYKENTKGWTVEPGKYNILVGSSSRDIRQHAELMVTQ